MRIVRFRDPQDGRIVSGVLDGEEILVQDRRRALRDVTLEAPCAPTKLVCVGRNYAAHAQELGNEIPEEPLLFFKPPSAVVGPEEPIVLPRGAEVHYEAELAVVIGERCRNVSADDAMRVVLGFTCMNDVSNRTAQKWEKNWVRAKGFDTSAPLGPMIVTPDEIDGPFHVQLRLNGELRQDGWTDAFLFPIPMLIETITSIMTLEAGDVIATGTPAGVGPLRPGDVAEVVIDGIGTLRNPVL